VFWVVLVGSGIVDGSSTTIKYSADGKFPIKTTNALGHLWRFWWWFFDDLGGWLWW
jgi:hypothetical protein